ncbi:MAG TPA: methyltransferase [Rhodanobacteraceae bacterium]
MRTSCLMMTASMLALPLAAWAGHGPLTTPAQTKAPTYVTAAINDPARKADTVDKAVRMSPQQLAQLLTFTGIKPGDTVIELVPGSGYWTRLFSQMVKPGGAVYTVWPEQMLKYSRKSLMQWKRLAAGKHYADVRALVEPAQTVTAPAKADVVFTSDNYHDYHNIKGLSIAAFDKSVFDALKPGGLFIVIDHIAPAGSGTKDTDTFHRIDPAAVKKEIEAAGFVFAGSSPVLLNPKDPLDIAVFAKSIRGHTSQFAFRFRKPAK